jgi:hypothetical protein
MRGNAASSFEQRLAGSANLRLVVERKALAKREKQAATGLCPA